MPDAQLIAILVAAMVAGVVLFRLYAVLGRRTGHEPDNQPAPAPLRDIGAVPAEAAPAESGAEAERRPEGHGLLDIELADKNFDRDHFLKGARTAYEMIQKAYADADRLTLRPLLSDEVYAAFERELAGRTGAAERLSAIADARIVDAALAGDLAEITVLFRASFLRADGSVREAADRWTFARRIGAPDPNWTLVATAGEMP